MTIIEAVYREVAFGLCGTGGALEELVDSDKVEQDMRTDAPAHTDENYPYILFRSVNDAEDNQVNHQAERVEIEVIGLRSSPAVGDDLLVRIRDIIKDHFQGKQKTWGKFDQDGGALPNGGLKMRCHYINAVPGFDNLLKEKVWIMMFRFSTIRA